MQRRGGERQTNKNTPKKKTKPKQHLKFVQKAWFPSPCPTPGPCNTPPPFLQKAQVWGGVSLVAAPPPPPKFLGSGQGDACPSSRPKAGGRGTSLGGCRRRHWGQAWGGGQCTAIWVLGGEGGWHCREQLRGGQGRRHHATQRTWIWDWGTSGGGAGTGMALSWPVPTGVTLEMVGCKPRHRDGGVLSCPQPQLVVEAA